jgi:hypothetical protein
LIHNYLLIDLTTYVDDQGGGGDGGGGMVVSSICLHGIVIKPSHVKNVSTCYTHAGYGRKATRP